jgi:hypothetical protein
MLKTAHRIREAKGIDDEEGSFRGSVSTSAARGIIRGLR